MDLHITSLAQRPDLAPVFDDFPDSWPEFLYHDIVSDVLFEDLMQAYPESNVIAVDPADPSRPVARACAVPYSRPLDDLPPGGYDDILLTAAADLAHHRDRGRLAAAVEITIRPDRRGQGLSAVILAALRRTLAELGYDGLVAPVRPSQKHEHPALSMTSYLEHRRPDGLPADAWLRTHVRAGATVVGVAQASMTIAAPLAHWRRWTGLPFDVDGPVLVPAALVPVHCDLTQDVATYVEPNVWVHHRL
jgi:GNAT superfamily N-acetyltransferase